MAKYTMTLKELTDSKIDIFKDWSYPIFDEDYRATLNERILRHYYLREIGFESYGMFKYYLNTKMNEIMPYYNKIYTATNLELRILNNYEVTETTSTETKDIESDTPQGQIDLNTSEFVSGIRQNEYNSTHTASGNIGVQTDAEAVRVYTEALLNVDLMVLKELNELFMGIY